MNKLASAAILFSLVVVPLGAKAQDGEPAIEPTPWYEDNHLVSYPDNTGPLGAAGTSDTAADIVSESEEEVAGALRGEITLKKYDDILEVYSNGNLVEKLVKGAGGTGMIVSESTSTIAFQPTGRPVLNCPVQDNASWFGPCKVEEDGEAGAS